jgi:hypothetical protein
MVGTVKLVIDIDEADLELGETFTFRIVGIDNSTSIIIRGNGIVTLCTNDRAMCSINLIEMALRND